MSFLRSALFVPFVLFVASSPSRATSAFLRDGLSFGGCREAKAVQLPEFPAVSVETKFLCWHNCRVEEMRTVQAEIELTQVAGGTYLGRVIVNDPSGHRRIWTGKLLLTYSRTWAEQSPRASSPDLQVWRFVVNGDFFPSSLLLDTLGDDPAFVPPCARRYSRFHVQGFMDFARDLNTDEFSVAFAFDHDVDSFEHAGGISLRPGDFHEARSYTWVGPAAGFVVNPNLATDAGRCDGSLRGIDYNAPLLQVTEARQASGGLVRNEGRYGLEDPTGPLQYNVQQFQTVATCLSTAIAVPFGGLPGLVGKSLGEWIDPEVYPGRESLHIERGHVSYHRRSLQEWTQPYFVGVQTQGGFPAHGFITQIDGSLGLRPLSRDFIDLGDATLPDSGSAPRIGRLSLSDKMCVLNVD